jgi:hypothetical protein
MTKSRRLSLSVFAAASLGAGFTVGERPARADKVSGVSFTVPDGFKAAVTKASPFAEYDGPDGAVLYVETGLPGDDAAQVAAAAYPSDGLVVKEADLSVAGRPGHLAVRHAGDKASVVAATLTPSGGVAFVLVTGVQGVDQTVDAWAATSASAQLDGSADTGHHGNHAGSGANGSPATTSKASAATDPAVLFAALTAGAVGQATAAGSAGAAPSSPSGAHAGKSSHGTPPPDASSKDESGGTFEVTLENLSAACTASMRFDGQKYSVAPNGKKTIDVAAGSYEVRWQNADGSEERATYDVPAFSRFAGTCVAGMEAKSADDTSDTEVGSSAQLASGAAAYVALVVLSQDLLFGQIDQPSQSSLDGAAAKLEERASSDPALAGVLLRAPADLATLQEAWTSLATGPHGDDDNDTDEQAQYQLVRAAASLLAGQDPKDYAAPVSCDAGHDAIDCLVAAERQAHPSAKSVTAACTQLLDAQTAQPAVPAAWAQSMAVIDSLDGASLGD